MTYMYDNSAEIVAAMLADLEKRAQEAFKEEG